MRGNNSPLRGSLRTRCTSTLSRGYRTWYMLYRPRRHSPCINARLRRQKSSQMSLRSIVLASLPLKKESLFFC